MYLRWQVCAHTYFIGVVNSPPTEPYVHLSMHTALPLNDQHGVVLTFDYLL